MRLILAALLLAAALPAGAAAVTKAKFVSAVNLHLSALSSRSPASAAAYLRALPNKPAPALAQEVLVEALAKPAALKALAARLDGETAARLEETAASLSSPEFKRTLALLRKDLTGDSNLRERGAELKARLDDLFDGGARVDLTEIDPADTEGLSRKKAEKLLAREIARLQELQERLYAGKRHRVLIVLQGMDTAGKDGIIKHALKLNVQGAKVAKFGRPTDEELSHHFLWRIRKHLPEPGMIAIFNRSHYEDILVPSVDQTLSPARLKKRYAEINAFEKELADDGVTIIKVFPYISKEEQRERLQARIDEPEKRWKWDDGDLVSRRKWSKFMKTYENIFALTSAEHAPWHVVPADKKWYRNYAVARLLREALESLDLKYPDAKPGLEDIVVE